MAVADRSEEYVIYVKIRFSKGNRTALKLAAYQVLGLNSLTQKSPWKCWVGSMLFVLHSIWQKNKGHIDGALKLAKIISAVMCGMIFCLFYALIMSC